MGSAPSQPGNNLGTETLRSEFNEEEMDKVPAWALVIRRDGKDYSAVKAAIAQGRETINAMDLTPKEKSIALQSCYQSAWSSFQALTALSIEELKPVNERMKFDPDYWYELNTANAVLFSNLSLNGIEELLPGRLFTTRMPRDLITHPENAEAFETKVKQYSLHAAMVLTEPQEYHKYAGSDLETFYESLGIQFMSRPIPDFNIPQEEALIQNIKDITFYLAEGRNVLVHCAGGSGRTGMIIASVFRNLGIHDPIAWIRRVKSVYVETQAQEDFVNTMPLGIDNRICQHHPILAKAIAAQHLLTTLTVSHLHPPTPRSPRSGQFSLSLSLTLLSFSLICPL
jgi:hypothetical protein